MAAVDAGCDALGFVFYKKSPRYIRPQDAKKIIRLLPKDIIKVGVFANAKEKDIKHTAKLCGLNLLQFHGNESAAFCKRFKGYKIIKSFRVREPIDEKKLLAYRPFAYLFDTYLKSKIGGTGKAFNWKLVRHINGLNRPVFLSGGLSERNVKQAIKALGPDWVDVSSSVELRPGKKDQQKVREFVSAAKLKDV